jgi:proteasome beta subunit
VFSGQTYRGSSFLEFLRTDHPTQLPDFDGGNWAGLEVPVATTVLSLVYDDGVLMAGDRLATEGNQVGTRDIEKVFKIDDTCLMAIAGAAGPAVEMMKMFRLELEHYQKLEDAALTFEGKANRLSFLLRQNLPAAMQGLVVMPLFCGYDHEKGRGRIYKFDITGGRYSETEYYATGSGGKDARAGLKKNFRHKNFTRADAIEATVEALVDAADEDTATAGFDINREIYPICKLVTHGAVEEASEEELLASYNRIMERRRSV